MFIQVSSCMSNKLLVYNDGMWEPRIMDPNLTPMCRSLIHSLKIRMTSHPCNEYDYNIPRACLLKRSPFPAVDLKSNRSGL